MMRHRTIYFFMGIMLTAVVSNPAQAVQSARASVRSSTSLARAISASCCVPGNVSELLKIMQLVDVLGGRPEHARILLGAGREFGIDPVLLASLVFVESNFREKVCSRCGAQGLMQIKPVVAKVLGVTDPWDPHQNIMAGAAYLRHCFERYRKHPESTYLALAAYNIGPGPVRKLVRSDPAKRFVVKVLRVYNRFTDIPIPIHPRASKRLDGKKGYKRQADARR